MLNHSQAMPRRISCLLILLGLAALSASARPGAAGRPFVCGLVSPDGHLSVDIARQDGAITYTLSAGRTPLLLSSPLGFRLRGGAAVPSAGWLFDVASSRKVRDVWKPLWGKRAEVPDRYRETVIRLRRPGSSETLLCAS